LVLFADTAKLAFLLVAEPHFKGWRFFMELTDRVAIVTGAASRIARAVAELLARHGAAVMVADGNVSGRLETVEQIHADGGVNGGVKVDHCGGVKVGQ
jgi:NAD(P)-dependent dehydrogenase (short-subunit alcohol dehydrogenase family)